MFDDSNCVEKAKELIGQKGVVGLTKALAGIPDIDITKIDNYINDIKVIPIGISFWLSKTLNNLKKNENIENKKIPATEFFISLTKNDKNLFTGFFLKEEKKLCEFNEQDLPHVIALCLTAGNFLNDSKNEKDNLLSKSLQRIINELVNEFHFYKKNIEIKLQKNETICPDCKETIKLTPDVKKICICYKFLGKNSLHVFRDGNNNLKLSFGPKWGKENISLFLQAFQTKTKEYYE